MKNKFNNVSKLLIVTGCVSVLAYNIATAAPLTYDMSQPAVRSEFNAPNKINLTGSVNFDDNGQKVNLSLRNTDVQQVLRMFADKAGLNIVFHQSATGTVTLDLVDVRLEDAFKMVLKMCNLTYVIKDKTMMVVSTNQAETLNLTKDSIGILPVKYADAAYLANFLNNNIFGLNTPGLSFGPIVTTNADRNELLIFGTDTDYQMAKKIVDRFDKKPLMTTYRVNHTTPFEMAKMICETLFRLPFEGSTAQLGGGRAKLNANLTTKSSKDSAPDGALGGGSVACVYSSAITTGNISSYSTKPSMILYVQPELGTLTLIGGSEHQIQLVNEFILDNDRKQPQALLEISIITLSEEGSKEFNNTWLMANKNIGLSFSGKNGLGGAYSWHGSKVSTVSNSASMTLQQQISYLISNSKGRILANPKVFVTNGKTTTIDLTQDYIKSTTVQILTSGSGAEGSNASVQRTFETGDDNGIKIEVTPFISPDGYVSLDITPEYASTLRDVMDEYSGYEYTATTLLQRHNLELKSLRIKDEETLLIGGIIQEEEKENVSKVPILGDIPVVGFFFKNQTKKLIKNELLFMITPRIIKDTEDVAEL